MAILENLKLVKKEIDTRMAEEYVNKVNEFTWPESGQFFIEDDTNGIIELLSVSDVTEVLEDQNAYKDVRDGHIKLMSQILRCSSAVWNTHKNNCLYFSDITPLYNLAAAVAGSLYSRIVSPVLVVVDSNKLRPLCKYFAQLCWNVGFNLPIMYTNPNSIDELKCFNLWTEPAGNNGCTGVIAEKSDLDSAIDAFIDSSVTAPWRLTQIYVQESIFEDFKESLAARARVAADGDLVVGDKTFLIECLQGGQGIPAHAYRTTKELLALIKTPYLSVWAAETALSNEISLRSPSYTVWVNEYGTFYGPPRSALSVYNQSCDVSSSSKLQSWQKLQTVERFDILVAAIKASEDGDVGDCLSEFTRERSRDFVEVTDRTVCFGVQKPLGMVHIDRAGKGALLLLLNVLHEGNGVTLKCTPWKFVDELSEFGVPICLSDSDGNVKPMILERMKVVRTNYGTIFAN